MSSNAKNVRTGAHSEPLDAIDERLLAALVDDARISNKQLAELVGIAPSTALMRTRALSERGIVQGFEAKLASGDSDGGASCASVVASFGEDPEASKPLLDVEGIDFKLYTVYRPAQWPEGKVPIITWGNGTCAKTEGYGALLRYVASHGYIVVAANALDVACAQILQQQWAAAGITVKLNPMETAPLIDLWVKGTYPTLMSIALSWTPDPDQILQRLNSQSDYGKAQGYSDTELDAMIAAARATVDPAARAAANLEIQKRIAENAYLLQIYQYPLRWELWWNYVEGYVPLAANIRSFVREASVTK